MPPKTLSFEEFAQGGELKVEQPQLLSFEEFSQGGEVKLEQPKTEQEKLSFTQRFGEDLQKRIGLAEEISDAVSSGEQTFAEGVLQIAGKVGVGGTFDLIGQGIVSTFRALPDAIEQPIRNATSAFFETDFGKAGIDALQGGIEKYNEWKQGNQRAARNFESIVDIGLLFAPTRVKQPAQPTKVGALGERAIISGEKAAEKQKISSIEELVRPQQTKVVREAQVGRTTEARGVLREKEILPSVSEKAIAKEVAKIQGISTTKTLQGNFNLIVAEASRLAEKLISDLKKNDFIFPKKELSARLNETRAVIAENPTIVGDAEKIAEKLITSFERFVNQNKATGSGLLQARKEFDAWIKQQKGGSIFD